MAIDIKVNNSCDMESKFCPECNSHFLKLRPLVKDAIITRHFTKDVKDETEAENIVKSVLDCSHIDFTELHKFEENVDGIMLFRAKKDERHIVYCIHGSRIIFLRSIRNFEEYKKFIDDRKGIKRMVESLDSSEDKLYKVA
jgi:hypothetical protein